MKKTSKSFLRLTLGTALLLTSACTSASLDMREEVANRLAAPAWMVQREIPAGQFNLTAYERMHTRYAPADIYIEGDGLAWMTKKEKSRNPTPKNPVALHLATRDKADNVAYIARPCQYSRSAEADGSCDSAYWSGKRFAPEVLESYNQALDEIKRRYDISEFNLIGFSGGGAVAAILAAQRDDVATLRTVAGNLDHKAHSAYHDVSMLDESLNPPDFADKLATVPQIHFIGGQDSVVPPAILHSYLQALGETSCVQYELIQEAEHEKGWVEKWPALLAKTPQCAAPAVQEPVFMPEPEPIVSPRETPDKP